MARERTSAKDGFATWNGTRIGEVTNIEVNSAADVDVGATSSTGGQKDRTVGHKDNSGSFTMQEKPTFSEGDSSTLVVNYKSGDEAYNGQAVIVSIRKGVPIADGTRLTWDVEWGQQVSTSSGA